MLTWKGSEPHIQRNRKGKWMMNDDDNSREWLLSAEQCQALATCFLPLAHITIWSVLSLFLFDLRGNRSSERSSLCSKSHSKWVINKSSYLMIKKWPERNEASTLPLKGRALMPDGLGLYPASASLTVASLAQDSPGLLPAL